jgi:hypothetical protein
MPTKYFHCYGCALIEKKIRYSIGKSVKGRAGVIKLDYQLDNLDDLTKTANPFCNENMDHKN